MVSWFWKMLIAPISQNPWTETQTKDLWQRTVDLCVYNLPHLRWPYLWSSERNLIMEALYFYWTINLRIQLFGLWFGPDWLVLNNMESSHVFVIGMGLYSLCPSSARPDSVRHRRNFWWTGYWLSWLCANDCLQETPESTCQENEQINKSWCSACWLDEPANINIIPSLIYLNASFNAESL